MSTNGASATRDPIGFELFKNTLLSIADEMALTILRTAYSGVLKDNMDYSTAFCDRDGQTVAQGLTLPGHLSSFPDALAAVIARYGDRIRPGDVFALNDPFEGGMHLPDVFILKPIFHDGERVAFAATICHQTDMGGRVAGSNASDSTEIFQEGLRIPPVKMYDAGEPNETLFRLLEKNVRLPVRVFGDMRAQLAACHIAEEAFGRLVAKHGVAQVTAYMREIVDYTERLTRAALRDGAAVGVAERRRVVHVVLEHAGIGGPQDRQGHLVRDGQQRVLEQLEPDGIGEPRGHQTSITMLPQASRLARAPGGTTQVASYSSMIAGPSRGVARSPLDRMGVTIQPAWAPK